MKHQYIFRLKAYDSRTKHKITRIHPYYGTQEQAQAKAETLKRKVYEQKFRQAAVEVFEVTNMRYVITV